MDLITTTTSLMEGWNRSKRRFFIRLIGALLTFVGRATMQNLSRYPEITVRQMGRWSRKPFDFLDINDRLLEQGQVKHKWSLGIIDATFLAKSGKKTSGLGSFYNGCANRNERGLEATVVAVTSPTEGPAYTLLARQTPPKSDNGETSIDFAARMLEEIAPTLKQHTNYLLADGAYSKRKFMSKVEELELFLVSKLRYDAALHYPYTGPRHPRGGRPRKYDKKVDYQDLSGMDKVSIDGVEDTTFTGVVYHNASKSKVRVVIINPKGNDSKGRGRVILFSTDTELDAETIVAWYSRRFQIEFAFRDAKQHTGLGQAQVRDAQGLHFFINASLTALNACRLQLAHDGLGKAACASIATEKRRRYNECLLRRVFDLYAIDPQQAENDDAYRKVLDFGAYTTRKVS